MVRPQLADDEHGQRDGRHGERAGHVPGRPAVRVARRIAPGQPVDDQRHEKSDAHEAAPVEPAYVGIPPLFLNQQRGGNAQYADRHVHIENQMPTVIVHQKTAHQRSEGDGRRSSDRPQTERRAELLGGKFARNDGQSQRLDNAAAHPLQCPGKNQELVDGGPAATPRSERKQNHAEHVYPLVAVAVGQPAGRRQHDRHRNHIGRDDPLGRRKADVKDAHDRGKPYVDDRHVKHRHERTHHDHGEYPPFVTPALLQPDLPLLHTYFSAMPAQKKCHLTRGARRSGLADG